MATSRQLVLMKLRMFTNA